MHITDAKEELFIRTSIQSNAGTAVLLLTEQCPANELWAPQFAAVENTSTESVTVQWCIRRSSDTRLMGADSTVATLKAIATNVLPFVGPGEQLGAQIIGAAVKGACWLTVTGWRFRARIEPDRA